MSLAPAAAGTTPVGRSVRVGRWAVSLPGVGVTVALDAATWVVCFAIIPFVLTIVALASGMWVTDAHVRAVTIAGYVLAVLRVVLVGVIAGRIAHRHGWVRACGDLVATLLVGALVGAIGQVVLALIGTAVQGTSMSAWSLLWPPVLAAVGVPLGGLLGVRRRGGAAVVPEGYTR